MKNGKIHLPRQVQAAISILEQNGFEAYAVGGCIRDAILGRIPNDWDITTSARPEQTKACFDGFRTIETGIQHGTLTVILDGMPLEITTYRHDGEYADNRHPIRVTFSDHIRDDLARRDFTVNAMAYRAGEELVDLFDGRADLENRLIRCVGDAHTRFHEDGLRILRAIRFASVLDFDIEEQTAKEIHACRELLHNIAAERIRVELCKLLCGKGAVRILREYADVIGVFLPEMTQCVGFAQNSKYHCYDVYEHTLHALAKANDDLVVRLSLLFHDIGKPHCYTEDENGGHFKGHAKISVVLTEQAMKRLRFDNATSERVKTLVEIHDNEYRAEPRSVKRLMRLLSDEDILRLMEIKRCDRLAHAPAFCELSSALEEIPRVMRELREADACLALKDLAVKGDDLMALGIPKGKEIGRILNLLLEQVLDGDLENEKEALLKVAKQLL